MSLAISRHYRQEDFPGRLTLEDKIAIFSDRVRGWQLDPADQCMKLSHHAGFIVLYALLHYFEMIAKFKKGYVPKGQEGKSEYYFTKGLTDARQYLLDSRARLTKDVARDVYKKVRCCLYHTGMIGPGIMINHNMNYAMQIDGNNISVNPLLLINAVERHFNDYLRELNNPNSKKLREHFEARFDYQHA